MIVLTQEPNLNDYISVVQHRQSTPASFSDEQPIVYYHAEDVKSVVTGSLPGDISGELSTNIIIADSAVCLWFPDRNIGLNIKYPSIVLHAVQTDPYKGVYLQLAGENDDFIEVLVKTEDSQKMYEALSECSCLHPEPEEENSEEEDYFVEDDEEILADTNGQADDLQGNSINGGGGAALEVELPESVRAGTRRPHEDGNESDDENSKWRRTL